MIPTVIETHLRENHRGFEHHQHTSAMTAQDLAAADHVTGFRVAKPVVVRVGGRLALAVVSAAERVSLGMLEEATGERAELVPEAEFASRFVPCESGAEPPLSLFGLPIFADEKFLHADKVLMQAGTHED
ncbi:MAG TPA: YbaK/EbsC family protein, partial [Anaeromyxobacter sp.]